MTDQTVKAVYDELSTLREPYLNRAYACAKLTIPALLPKKGSNSSTTFETPYQSFGAKAVNNLASKFLLSLFPSNKPFFRFSPSEQEIQLAVKEGKEQGVDTSKLRTQLEAKLKEQENIVLSELENTPYRAPLFEGFKHLIVTGNILLFREKNGKVRAYPLNHYVVRRDPIGNVLEIIIHEVISNKNLPEAIKRNLSDQAAKEANSEIYTRIINTGKEWSIYQEIDGKKISETEGSYPLEALPYLPLRFIRVDGESYGRSHVEEYFGDLNALEGLRQAIVEYAAIAAKTIFLLDPNGSTKAKQISKAENGDFVVGKAQDVSVLRVEKQADMSVAERTAAGIEMELAKAFLLNSSVQRNAERVTAEEIRLMARELEDTLGGIYSILTQELQLPWIKITMFRLQRDGKMAKLPDSVKPRILTGLEALGRTDERDRMMLFLQDLSLLGQSAMARLNVGNVVNRLGTQHQINTDGLLIDEDEFQRQQQQAQMMAMVQRAAPNVVNGLMQQQGQPANG
jgi:hypothetical protein